MLKFLKFSVTFKVAHMLEAMQFWQKENIMLHLKNKNKVERTKLKMIRKSCNGEGLLVKRSTLKVIYIFQIKHKKHHIFGTFTRCYISYNSLEHI